jgi:hypothetical protein
MKKTIKIISLIIGISFFFTGCYTIVWDPREEYPNEDNYTESDGFYESDYYGGYGDYYESPWWITTPVFVVYPGGEDSPTTKDRNNGRGSDTETIRNSNGRGNTDRESNITTPVTTTNSGNSNNSNNVDSSTPKRDSDSGSTTSSSSTSNTRNSGSNDTRNSSGSRNSGSGRR